MSIEAPKCSPVLETCWRTASDERRFRSHRQALDLVDDETLKSICRETIVWLTNALIASNWWTRNPPFEGGKPAKAWFETFYTYPHHRLSIPQLARHVASDQFTDVYMPEEAPRAVAEQIITFMGK